MFSDIRNFKRAQALHSFFDKERINFSRGLVVIFSFAWIGVGSAMTGPRQSSAELKIGERLFFETRFSRYFSQPSEFANRAGQQTLVNEKEVSCRKCHPAPSENGLKLAALFPVPEREDQQTVTSRNSPALFSVLVESDERALLHYDGEFATTEDLIFKTFLGRNFGWLPEERVKAQKHFARIIREDTGMDSLASNDGHLPYSVLLLGTRKEIPFELRLAPRHRLDVAAADDEEILNRCAKLVAAYLASLQFSRDATGLNNGSSYDAFLALNRLPRAPANGETAASYGRRLREVVAALRAPRFVDDASRRAQRPGREFRFGELELKGMKIFFREGVGRAQTGGAGNCAECHVPPQFTDFAFHNTGVAQDDYDARHGAGAFMALKWPRLAERNADYDRWLPPTPEHPRAKGNARAAVEVHAPERADVGLWNVYGNPDLPKPQALLERRMNPSGSLSPDEVLARALARFKTTTVRDLDSTAPYFHTGALGTLEEVVEFYRGMSELAREGKLLNAPPEFFGVRLEAADVAPLVAFLRALDEN